jgi:carbamoyltransferase
MVILGIYTGHNASASLMIDGKIIFAVQEERFINFKNFNGYPKKSIDYCIKYVREKNLRIDIAGFAQSKLPIFPVKYPIEHFFNIEDYHNYYGPSYYSKKIKGENTSSYIKKIIKDKRNNKDLYLPYNKVAKKDYYNPKLFRSIQKEYLLKQSKKLIKKVVFLDHHMCHAYYSFYSSKIQKKNSCIVTIDSMGDNFNQCIWLNKKNRLVNIVRSSECDLARIYKFITLILKMKPDEHEFKVMGLSSYSKRKYVLDVYEKIFKKILKFDGLKIVHNERPKDLYNFLFEKTKPFRFDNIAGGLQYYLEKTLTELLKKIYRKYKIKNFYFSGGVSMNVKMYKDMGNLKFVDFLSVPPSGSDESLSLGACYYLSKNIKTKPLTNIYIGQNLIENNKTSDYKVVNNFFSNSKFKIRKKFNHKNLAKLLFQNEIIAVARGREEFGARALGNRSIIANPSNYDAVQKINESIKNRDFWMPFALTILKNEHKKFIKNKKNFRCDFMTMAFDTVKDNFSKIKAGCHPYDNTVRPQILEKEFNPMYHSIIKEFFNLTKIPALLNTSLNLHGYPVASTLKDVIFTFKNSDLKFLYINDNLLIEKKY